MHERERSLRAICFEVGAQPLRLRGVGRASADLRTIAVQRDDVPRTQIETVKPSPSRAGASAIRTDPIEIVEIRNGSLSEVLMVSGDRIRDALEEAERWLVERLEIGG